MFRFSIDELQERIDKLLAEQAKEMSDLRNRLRKLEGAVSA